MFDIGATELLMIVIVAVVVIGPKDMPLAMRTAGRWIGKMRKISGHVRAGIDAMVRDAEMEDLEKKWRAQNDAIMKAHPGDGTHPGDGGPEMEPIAARDGADFPVPGAESRETSGLETADADPPLDSGQPGQQPLPVAEREPKAARSSAPRDNARTDDLPPPP